MEIPAIYSCESDQEIDEVILRAEYERRAASLDADRLECKQLEIDLVQHPVEEDDSSDEPWDRHNWMQLRYAVLKASITSEEVELDILRQKWKQCARTPIRVNDREEVEA